MDDAVCLHNANVYTGFFGHEELCDLYQGRQNCRCL